MKNVYVIKLGNLYLRQREISELSNFLFPLTDDLSDTRFSRDLDHMKEVAEGIGGKVYKINLEEVE